MNVFWLLKMKRLADNPPSKKRIIFVLGILAFIAALAFYEHFFGWPEFLTVDKGVGRRGFVLP